MAAALCQGSRGGGASLAFYYQPGAYNTQTLIGALDQLRRALGGEKPTLLWDGMGCPLTAVKRCGPGWRPSGPGWWWTASRPTHRT